MPRCTTSGTPRRPHPSAAAPTRRAARHVPVGSDRVLAAQRELPADVGLQLEGRYSPFERCPVQGAAGAAGVARAVQEDAGARDEPGGDGPLRVPLEHAGLQAALRSGTATARRRASPAAAATRLRVLLVGEVRSVRAAALHRSGRRPCQDSLAAVAVDALPRAGEERHVDTQVRSSAGSSKLTHSWASEASGSALGSEASGPTRKRADSATWTPRDPRHSRPRSSSSARGAGARAGPGRSRPLARGRRGAPTAPTATTSGSARRQAPLRGTRARSKATSVSSCRRAASPAFAVRCWTQASKGESRGCDRQSPTHPRSGGRSPAPGRPDRTRGKARAGGAHQAGQPLARDHGGHVELVGVDGPIAYVEMSGGCQGCGMARATLSQGIAVAITDAVSGDHRGRSTSPTTCQACILTTRRT